MKLNFSFYYDGEHYDLQAVLNNDCLELMLIKAGKLDNYNDGGFDFNFRCFHFTFAVHVKLGCENGEYTASASPIDVYKGDKLMGAITDYAMIIEQH